MGSSSARTGSRCPSFSVRRTSKKLRGIVAGRAGVMSKLEKPSAVEHLDAIVALSDAVMVARGDLGVEMAARTGAAGPAAIVRACRQAGKPSIVATQMLELMIEVPTPTRAEASDVASAIYHGADAVMLSAESASGKFPLEAVTMMDRIITAAENDRGYYRPMSDAARPEPAATIPDAICASMRLATEPAADRRRRHLHDVGVEQPARIPRAAGDLDPQHGRERRNRTAAHAGLGHPFGRSTCDQHPGRDEHLCVRDRAAKRVSPRKATPLSSLPELPSVSREQRTC